MPNIAQGLIFPTYRNHGDDPTGFERDTNFDGMFARGCSSTDVTGGATGGYAEHQHIILSSHLHQLEAQPSVGTANDNAGVVSTAPSNHRHSSNLSLVSPIVQAANNYPPFHTVIFRKSLGTTSIFPSGFIFYSDIGQFSPSPFNEAFAVANGSGSTPNLINKFLLGAATGANPGSVGGVSSHAHDFLHFHTSPHTSGTSAPTQLSQGRRGTGISGTHTQGVTITNVGATEMSGTTVMEPPYVKWVPWYSLINHILRTGMIGMWDGLKADIPPDWTEVTDAQNLFAKTNSGTSTAYYDEEAEIWYYSFDDVNNHGGVSSHGHTSSHNHLAATASTSNPLLLVLGGAFTCASTAHTHIWDVYNSDAGFADQADEKEYPPFRRVFFVKYTEPKRTSWFNWFCRLFTFGSTEATFGDTHVTFGGRYAN